MLNRKVTFLIGLKTTDGDILNRNVTLGTVVSPLLGDHGCDGFSVIDQIGYWKGSQEPSIKVEVYADAKDAVVEFAVVIAARLAFLCQQECVLYAVEPVETAGLAYCKSSKE